jgi:hypothetical protein
MQSKPFSCGYPQLVAGVEPHPVDVVVAEGIGVIGVVVKVGKFFF